MLSYLKRKQNSIFLTLTPLKTMFDTNNRDSFRKIYFDSWQKFQNSEELQPLEHQIVAIVREHPEYHALIENPDESLDKNFMPEEGEMNPFLHMGLHMGLMEQVGTDRPEGIGELYRQFSSKLGGHNAEHEMMDCLAEAIWTAQRNKHAPDDAAYLSCLKVKLRNLK